MSKNLYKTLGINKSASSKDIKAAFYDLSKRYHPDRNPEDAAAVIKFRDIVEAYEVLSNKDRRRVYDKELQPAPRAGMRATRTSPFDRRRQYTDLDIDYRDLQRFQESARRRAKAYREAYEQSDDFKMAADNYKSNLANQREAEEARLRAAIQREQAAARYRTPKFEELLQQERQRQNFKARQNAAFAVFGVCVAFTMLTIMTR